MATDFFERQDVARRNTGRLIVLFALAVIGIILSIHVLLAAVFGYVATDPRTGNVNLSTLFDPGILALAAGGTALVVGGGSLFKIAQLSGGGRVIAEELGGRLVPPDTSDPVERQLINVVEEMAVASGTPVPPVYLLEDEPGINAFAAGFTPAEAVIGITRGAVSRLSRDELQGVIAHEFSHILNGDMRLNIRLIGLLHGILIIGIMGYYILRISAYGPRSRRSRDGGNTLPLLALGAGLAVVGFVGTFFGNLIKAAVSRQREFLADSAAVQFTRQAEGIAGALKKIGGGKAGSSVRNPNAPEASHMFFGRATTGFTSLFSTHPPLEARIRRLDPTWDGTFDESSAPQPVDPPDVAGVSGFAPGSLPLQPREGLAGALDHIGRPAPAHIDHAAQLLRSIPAELTNAAHHPHSARALIYALLLDKDAEIRRVQVSRLQAVAAPHVFEEMLRLMPDVAALDARARMVVVEIALPALRTLTPEQYQDFRKKVTLLIEADARLSLFEWALLRVLLHGLAEHHGDAPRPGTGYRAITTLQPECEVLLTALARAGHDDEPSATRAFQIAWDRLGLPQTRMLAARDARFEALDAALDGLADATPAARHHILDAVVACATADHTVSAAEEELLRAVAATLGIPVPPVL